MNIQLLHFMIFRSTRSFFLFPLKATDSFSVMCSALIWCQYLFFLPIQEIWILTPNKSTTYYWERVCHFQREQFGAATFLVKRNGVPLLELLGVGDTPSVITISLYMSTISATTTISLPLAWVVSFFSAFSYPWGGTNGR